jgi:hypothetical protein
MAQDGKRLLLTQNCVNKQVWRNTRIYGVGDRSSDAAVTEKALKQLPHDQELTAGHKA